MRRGYTLIEMIAVTVILALVAAVVVPNLGTFKDGQTRRSFINGLPRLADQARVSAVTSGQTIEVVYDGNSLAIQRPATDEDEANSMSREQLPAGIEVSKFQLKGEESSPEEWAVSFYADGTCDSGGLELDEGGRPIAVIFRPKSASVLVQNGALGDLPPDRWQAGELAVAP